jgi:winged helix DNA-binding protein
MRSLTWDQVLGRRLARHHLTEPATPERLADVVGEVCGIHAQMLPPAELSIGARVDGVTGADVRAELWERRTLVKTYGIRGTLHLFPAAELGLWLAALRANPSPGAGVEMERAGIDRARKAAIVEAIGDALDGRTLTRDELGAEVTSRLGAWAGEEVWPAFNGMWPRWRVVLGAAAVAGNLCFAPSRGNKVVLAHPRQWVGTLADTDGQAALAEVLRRYLRAYGPVTHLEFAQWFNMAPAPALALVRSLADELEEVEVDGSRAWLLAADAALPWPAPEGSVRLLPHFDCYLRGSHPRDVLVPPAVQAAAEPDGRPRLTLTGPLPILLVDGAVAGVWERPKRGKQIEVRVQPYVRLRAGQRRQLESEAARVGEILGSETTLTIGEVATGPHM